MNTTPAVDATTVADQVSLDRRVPPFGGFNLTYLRIEIRRRLRNRSTLFFAFGFPVLLYFIVGYRLRNIALTSTPIAAGGLSFADYMMVSMALYGVMMSAVGTGASVAVERAQGWSRQLRLTPLNPFVNVLIKLLAGMVLGFGALLVTYLVGGFTGNQLSVGQWIFTGLAVWLLGSAVFTTLGLMMGYLFPGDSAAQVTSIAVVILAFIGGLFFPLSQMPDVLQTIAKFTPVYGISAIAREPLTGDAFDWLALLNAIVWFVLLILGTVWAFRRDTKRV